MSRRSGAFARVRRVLSEVRTLDQKVNVTNADRWRRFPSTSSTGPRWRRSSIPTACPSPTDDPTQWLFTGIRRIDVAVQLRSPLAGYRWPRQTGSGSPLAGPGARRSRALADEDGIVCMPSVRGERPAAERLRALLAAAYGEEWSPAQRGGSARRGRLRRASHSRRGCATTSSPSTASCSTSGRSSGRSGTAARTASRPSSTTTGSTDQTLEKLTYTYLGDWIERSSAPASRRSGGSRGSARRRARAPAQAQADPRRRGAVRHLRPLEAARRAADRLGARPRRRRPPQHPAVRDGRHPAQEPERSTGTRTAARIPRRALVSPVQASGSTTTTSPSPRSAQLARQRRERSVVTEPITVLEHVEAALDRRVLVRPRTTAMPPAALLWPDKNARVGAGRRIGSRASLPIVDARRLTTPSGTGPAILAPLRRRPDRSATMPADERPDRLSPRLRPRRAPRGRGVPGRAPADRGAPVPRRGSSAAVHGTDWTIPAFFSNRE